MNNEVTYLMTYPEVPGQYYGVKRVVNGEEIVVGFYREHDTAAAVCDALANEAYRLSLVS